MNRMIKCPPAKSYAFGLLKSGLGEARAHIAFQRNGFEVPEIEKALELLGMDKGAWRDSKGRTLHQVQTLTATAKAVRESGGPMFPKPFQVDEQVVMHSPHTGDDTVVSYRGKPSDGNAVVWTGKMQITIPESWLRHQGEKYVETPKSPEPEPKLPVLEPPSSSAVSESPMPTTKAGLIDELVGPKPADYSRKVEWEKLGKTFGGFTKAELLSKVETQRKSNADFKRLQEQTMVEIDAVKQALESAGNRWQTVAREIADKNGVTPPNLKNERSDAIYSLAQKIASKKLREGAPKPANSAPEEVMHYVSEKMHNPITADSKVRVGTNPTLHTVVRELPRSQGDLPEEKFYEVKNDKTGATQTVELHDLTPVIERTAAERAAVKPESIDDQLRAYKLDPSSFPDAASKRAALKRAKATQEPAANLGEGLPEGQGSTDAEISDAIKGENTHGFEVQIISKEEAEQIGSIPEARGYGGFFKDGKIYLLRENIRPGQPEALRQLLREEIGHGLLRTPEGQKLVKAFQEDAARQLTDAEKKVLTDAGYQPHQLLDEFIAKSMREKRPWWNESVLTVKSWLAKLGVKLSNEDAARLLLRQIKEKQIDQIEGSIAAGRPVGDDYDADVDFSERVEKHRNAVMREFLSLPKGSGKRISWNRIPAARIKKIWLDFGKSGVIRDEKGLSEIEHLALENIARIKAITELVGHESYDVKDMLESDGIELTPKEWENFYDSGFITNQYSDYAMKPLENLYATLFKAETPEEKLYAIDKILNVVHQRGDIADLFIEGGTKTLNEIASQGGYTSPEISPGEPVAQEEMTDELDTDSSGRPIQVGGRKFMGSEEQLSPREADRAKVVASVGKAKALVSGLKLPGAVDNEADSIIFRIDGDSNLGTDGKPEFPYDAEVGKLRNEMVKLLSANDDESLNLAVQLSKFINYNHDEWPKLVSKPLADEIRGLAAAKSSRAGQVLRMLKGAAIGKDLRSAVRNLDFSLKRIWAQNFGGDAYQTFVTRIVKNFSEFFTPEMLDKFSKENPGIQDQLELVAATARAEQANRLYRKIQAKLNPKNMTPAKLEKNAVAREEFDALIQQLEKIGVEIPEKNNPKISAREKLLLLVKDKTIEKVNADVEAAVKYGLSEAGKQAARNELMANKDALEELEGRFLAGEEPTPEQIEKGLELHAFRGIKGLRDTWLGYDPVTVRLAQDIVKEDFKGVRFGTPKARPADTRFNLTELAKQPDAEIARVLDAYLKNIEDNLNIADATPETRQRIRSIVEKQVENQIENVIRPKIRDIMFKAPKEKGAAKTDEQKIAEQVNAGLFGDERLNTPEMVRRVASKSIIKKLTPKVSEIAKAILDAPSFKQEDMEKAIFDAAVAKFDVDPKQLAKLAKVIYASLKPKIDEARKSAQDKAVKSMTPREQKAIPKTDTKLWDSIQQFFNAGGKDYDELLKKVAAIRGLPVPSTAEAAKMKALADKVDELSNLTPEAEARIRNNASLGDAEKEKAIANAQAEKEKINASEIGRATTQMAVEWAKFTKPFNWTHKTNAAKAAYEFAVANLLAKIGFPLRLSMHITSQLVVRTPTRPIAVALEGFYADRAAGKPTDLFKDISSGIGNALDLSLKTIPQALRAGRAQLTARGEVNASRLVSGVNALERIAAKAKEYDAKGDHVRATILKAVAFIRMSTRVVGAIDAFQGEFVEATELRHQIQAAMAKEGMNRAEIASHMDTVFGNMKADWTLALTDAKRGFDEQGKEPLEAELREAADRLLKQRMYRRVELMGLPRDSIRAYILRQRMAEAWQAPTEHGLGSVATKSMKALRDFGVKKGLPGLPVYFANAIGAGINYHLMLTPLYKLGVGGVKEGVGDSAWNESSIDRTHLQVKALVGTVLGASAVALVLNNYAKVQLHAPTDKNERERWTAQGHKVGTVEFQLPNGDFIPFSLTVGPFALLAPYFAGAGQLRTVLDNRAKKQAAMDAQAAKTGIPAGKLPPIGVTDLLGVAGQAAWSSILGGSTASGLVSSYSEFQVPNAQKAVAATIAPLIPYLPGLQEFSRMDGVALDSKTATVFDYLLPLPTSGARAVNALGDPVRTPNDIQRIIQAITGGTYPLPVSSEPDAAYDQRTQAAYSALLSSKFTPPEISPAKGYAINSTFRPMTPQELEQYTELRGQYLKTNLAALGAGATPQQAKRAYQQANTQALADMGIQSGAAARQKAPHGTIRRSRLSLGRSRTAGGLKISLKKLRRPAIRRTRKLRLRSSKSHASRLHLRRPKYV